MTEVPETSVTVIGVVKDDYASLSAILARLEGYRDVLRGATLTLWIGALGLGIANDTSIPVIGAAVLTPVLAWADLRLNYQHAVAHRRSIELEAIVAAYVRRVLETDRLLEADTQEKLDEALDQYQFGSTLTILRPTAGRVLNGWRDSVSWTTALFLLGLILLATVAALIEGGTIGDKNEPGQRCVHRGHHEHVDREWIGDERRPGCP